MYGFLSIIGIFEPGQQTGATPLYVTFLSNLEIVLWATSCVCVAGHTFIVLKFELASLY